MHTSHRFIALTLLMLGALFAGLRFSQAAHKSATAPPVTLKRAAASVAPKAAMGTNIVVNSTADGTNAALAGNATCDLREAIRAANSNTAIGQCPAGMVGMDTITFSVTGIINVASTLPALTEAVTIDGFQAPDSCPLIGVPAPSSMQVILNGGGGAFPGLRFNVASGGPSTVRGLVIRNFGEDGIRLLTPQADNFVTVECNYIGVSENGNDDQGNGEDGVEINNSMNHVIQHNLISGNNSDGVEIQGSDSTGNVIRGNIIGLNASGNAKVPNSDDGIDIERGANTIGGAAEADRNIISGNGGDGVEMRSVNTSGNRIIGNYIGLAANGTNDRGNEDNGVRIQNSPNNFIGGTTAGEGNLISGNGGGPVMGDGENGILISGNNASGNQVLGNIIGLDLSGTLDRGNKNSGVVIAGAPNNIIGGATVAARNIISGNGGGTVDAREIGVLIILAGATGNRVQGNFIGSDIVGTQDLGNRAAGVSIRSGASNNLIGGTMPGEGNLIFGNNQDNVEVNGMNSVGNSILGNSISGSGAALIQLGIDLDEAGMNGVTANDLGDADTGPNNVQNFPVLLCAVSGGGQTSVRGSLNSLASTTFRVEFFANDACDTAGNGEGKTFLGFLNVTTDGGGNVTFTATGLPPVAAGQLITATATNSTTGDTSEFSACQAVQSPTLSINDVTLAEGSPTGTTAFTFTVTLSSAACLPITVNYATADGTALAPGDYTAVPTTALTFAPGETTKMVAVTVNRDTTFEPDETFFVNLTNPAAPAPGEALATISDNQGLGTISNDDPQPTIAINDVTLAEGNAGTTAFTFTVSLSNPSFQTITVTAASADGTATTADSDYTAVAATVVTFNPGETSKTVTVNVTGEAKFELNETFFVNLTGPGNATISDNQGLGTITNDDTPPTISINDVTLAEGNAGATAFNFTVSLSAVSGAAASVTYTTADNTALTADSDYTAIPATLLTFNPGETSKTVTVNVTGDTKFEVNETFFVNLSGASNATISDSQGLGTVNNDDAPPTVSINDVPLAEGNAGTTAFTFTVSLSAVSGVAASVTVASADGTATIADGDYAALAATVVTFNPGETTKTVTVNVIGETKFEVNETFFVNLSGASNATLADSQGVGTINNDDAPPTISINDVTLAEGNAGTTAFTFTISLSAVSGVAASVTAASANGTATTADGDYAALAATVVTFNPGETTKTVTVNVNGEAKFEVTETFFVNLSGATNATIADNQGLGTISNDDAPPTIAINDVTLAEGNAGTTAFNFTVSLSAVSGVAASVTYATADGTALTANNDYTAVPPTLLTFNPGETNKTATVNVTGDINVELPETFFVNLSGASNATLADNQGLGTINNDDALSTPTNALIKLFPDDPLLCVGARINGAFGQTNTTPAPASGRVFAELQSLVVTPGSLNCELVPAAGGATTFCGLENGNLTWRGTLAAGQRVNVTYQAQIPEALPAPTQVCSTASSQFPEGSGAVVSAAPVCLTLNCPGLAGPGVTPDARSIINDGKAGSVLIYNAYTSSATGANFTAAADGATANLAAAAQATTAPNTRINITNTSTTAAAYVHLFFVDGSTCAVADNYLCLTANQTASFLASDLDPGTTGYLVAVAVDRTGCPIVFNHLIGDSYVKFASGHAANLAAEAVAAIPGGLTFCDPAADTALLRFDGINYNALPHVVAVDNVPSRADGNDTLLILNRLGGSLASGAATLGTVVGVFYDDAENVLSFNFAATTCQLRANLSNSFPRITPRFEQFVPAGRSGWLKLYVPPLIGVSGAVINLNTNNGPHNFNQGHNLHKLTLTNTTVYTIPVFPPTC